MTDEQLVFDESARRALEAILNISGPFECAECGASVLPEYKAKHYEDGAAALVCDRCYRPTKKDEFGYPAQTLEPEIMYDKEDLLDRENGFGDGDGFGEDTVSFGSIAGDGHSKKYVKGRE